MLVARQCDKADRGVLRHLRRARTLRIAGRADPARQRPASDAARRRGQSLCGGTIRRLSDRLRRRGDRAVDGPRGRRATGRRPPVRPAASTAGWRIGCVRSPTSAGTSASRGPATRAKRRVTNDGAAARLQASGARSAGGCAELRHANRRRNCDSSTQSCSGCSSRMLAWVVWRKFRLRGRSVRPARIGAGSSRSRRASMRSAPPTALSACSPMRPAISRGGGSRSCTAARRKLSRRSRVRTTLS